MGERYVVDVEDAHEKVADCVIMFSDYDLRKGTFLSTSLLCVTYKNVLLVDFTMAMVIPIGIRYASVVNNGAMLRKMLKASPIHRRT